LKKFKDVIAFSDYRICQSEHFKEDFTFYRILNKIEPQCEFIDKCPMYIHTSTGNLEELIKMTKEFCLSKQHIKCKRYKIRKSGVIPPNELSPNGKTAE